jgi:Phage tail-collar fibre protein
MSTLNLIITTAGQAALAQAGTLGPVVISKVAIGSGTWTTAPTASATALHTQIKQLDPSGSSTPSAGIIHITATDSGTDAYAVYEMGLYTSTGILFAIAGGTTLFLTKATSSSALFSIDLAITNVPSGSIVIGDTGFSPQATETVKGVAEIATTAEVTAGTDDTRMITPAKLAEALTNVVNEKAGYKTGPCFTTSNSVLYITPTEFAVPVGETWVFEFHAHWMYSQGGNTRPDNYFYISASLEKSGTTDVAIFTDAACSTAYGAQARAFALVTLQNSDTSAGKKLKFTTSNTNVDANRSQYMITLRKFKTADFTNNISIL